MSRTPEDISARIRATLATTEPGLSCERGTPERKIIDACSEAISEGYVDMYLVGSLLDIDNKVGLELEQFCAIWGFGRLQGKAAKGVVRVTVPTPLSTDQVIQLGSQFYAKIGLAGSGERMYFASTQAAVLVSGTYSVDIPVECTVVGTQGNIPPDSVTALGISVSGGTVTNLSAFTGGVDIETDQELRQRFKDTMMRNIAGTSDWYRAICLQNDTVSRVEVFGPTTMYKTQIAAPVDTLVLSLDDNVKYVWPDMEAVFINLGQTDEVFYRPGDDYTLSSGPSPVFTRNPSGQIVAGDIIDVEFQYVTRASRNDPVNGITNKVDVIIDGVNPYTVTEKTVMTATALTSSPVAWNYTGNFERVGPYGGAPTAGNKFVRLTSVPIVSFPDTLTIGTSVYTMGTHYWLLRSTTTSAGSHHEISGMEWHSSGPAVGTEMQLSYIYNRIPEVLSAIIRTSKQICTDVMVHQAKWRYITPCLSVEYDRTYSVSLVNTAIQNHLTRYFSSMKFGQHFKMAALLMAVQQVLGVTNVRLTTEDENPEHYGIEVFDDANDTDPLHVYTDDFRIDDNSLPVLLTPRLTRRAAS
jgi:uncharacterized phage protein gp47/JayE